MTCDEYRERFAALAAEVGLRRYSVWDSYRTPSGARLELRLRGRAVDATSGYNVARWCVLGDFDPADVTLLEALRVLAAGLPERFGEWGVRETIPTTVREPHGWGTGAFDDTKGT